jgi:hypothetical protein
MTKILKYKMFESSKNEDDVILNSIIPFVLKKYDELSKWGKKKTFKFAAPINRLMFEKRDGNWKLVIEALSWSGNDTNMLIQYVLGNAIKEKCRENGIELTEVGYAGGHSIYGSIDKYIVYNVEKNELEK